MDNAEQFKNLLKAAGCGKLSTLQEQHDASCELAIVVFEEASKQFRLLRDQLIQETILNHAQVSVQIGSALISVGTHFIIGSTNMPEEDSDRELKSISKIIQAWTVETLLLAYPHATIDTETIEID